MKAVAKYPAFCDESNAPYGYNMDETCKREIATLFAQMSITSAGFSLIEDSADTLAFHARGPLGLSGEADYKAFSATFYEGFDRSDELFIAPERVANDGYVGFAAAVWKYMTPQSPSPSMHNIITGFFVPNANDDTAGHSIGFGTTTMIAKNSSCGGGVAKPDGTARGAKFIELSGDLGLSPENDLTCEWMWTDFSWTGSSNK